MFEELYENTYFISDEEFNKKFSHIEKSNKYDKYFEMTQRLSVGKSKYIKTLYLIMK